MPPSRYKRKISPASLPEQLEKHLTRVTGAGRAPGNDENITVNYRRVSRSFHVETDENEAADGSNEDGYRAF